MDLDAPDPYERKVRIARIRAAAAKHVKTPSVKTAIVWDSFGGFDRMIGRTLDSLIPVARERGIPDDKLDEYIAVETAYIACQAAINVAKKRPPKPPPKRRREF